MGRRKAWALAGLLAAALSALLLQAPSARGDELLVNGEFEDAVADSWVAKGGDIEAVEGLGRDGSAAGVFSTDSSSYHNVRQCVSAWEGNAYTFQGYAAAPSETPLVSAYLVVWWYGQAECQGRELGTSGDPSEPVILELPGLWRALTVEVARSPASTRSARARIVIVQSNATVYLDDFSFTGPPAPTLTPTPTPSPTASPSPSPEPIASPTPLPVASPSPTTVPTETQAPTPEPSTPSPSPTASSWVATPSPVAELVNGGFEEADDEGRPLGWRKYGGELSRSSVTKWEGRFAAVFTSRTASTKWAYQTVAAEGGEAYVLSGYALKNNANVEAAYLRLSWYASPDGSGRAIDSVDSTTRLADDSPDFRFLTTDPVVAPTEAASAKVRLMLDPVSEAGGNVYFDAISLEETIMPSPSPEETATPPAATQTPLSPPLGDGESPTPSAATPATAGGEPQPPPSPTALRPPPTALAASSAGPEATASPPEARLQTETPVAGSGTRTPVVLYRERRAAHSIQGGEGVAGGADEGGGLSPIVLVLAVVLPAAAGAAIGFFVWRRWQKRARPL